MLPVRMLRAVLPTVSRIALRGPWYRAVGYDSLMGPPPGAPAGSRPQPLSAGGAARTGARFTPRAAITLPASSHGAIECLYLAEDGLTPLVEVAGVLAPPGGALPLRFEPLVMITIDGMLNDVVDLTDAATQTALGTTDAELTAPWLMQQASHLAGRGPLPPTQVLALEAFRAGTITALRYPSSKNPRGIGVVVFTSRLVPNRHSLAVFNRPTGRLQQSLP